MDLVALSSLAHFPLVAFCCILLHSTVAKWDCGSGRTNIRQLVSKLSLSESVVQGEPISGNSFLNYRKVRAWFRENQYRATRFSIIAKWECGSGRTNIGQLVSQLSQSESVVQGEPISGNSFLNYRKVRAWFRENQYRVTRFSIIAKWDRGSGRTNIRQLVSQLSQSESVVQGEPISGNSFLNYRKVRAWFRENQYRATRFSIIAKWDRGSGRTNIG